MSMASQSVKGNADTALHQAPSGHCYRFGALIQTHAKLNSLAPASVNPTSRNRMDVIMTAAAHKTITNN
jgi:hypothetical protein